MYGDFATLDGFRLSEEQIAELFADPAFQDYLDTCNVAAMIDEMPGPVTDPITWVELGGEG